MSVAAASLKECSQPARSCLACISFPRGASAAAVPISTGTTRADRATLHPSAFVGVDSDGTVYIVAHRSEMGTGIRTSLPLVVADELDADWKRVRIEQAIGDWRYGGQDTDGSHSIRDFFDVGCARPAAPARLDADRGLLPHGGRFARMSAKPASMK